MSAGGSTHIDDDVEAEQGHVDDDAAFVGRNLGVLNQLCQILLRDAVLGQDVEQDDADLVEVGHLRVQQDRHNVAHVVLDLLALSVRAHGQILSEKKVETISYDRWIQGKKSTQRKTFRRQIIHRSASDISRSSELIRTTAPVIHYSGGRGRGIIGNRYFPSSRPSRPLFPVHQLAGPGSHNPHPSANESIRVSCLTWKIHWKRCNKRQRRQAERER